MDIQEPKRTGFSLLEVLAAMAIAALTFGVLLRSVSLQILTISRATARYQSLSYASALLERKMAEGVTEDEAITDELDDYSYRVDTHVVTADPRVQQVEVVVKSNQGGGASLSAYRLRIRRRKR
ncbi:MAG: prepilin-type N-terminal cleavage/methylation domain-containing protein [Candidatus Eremiobacteraeota bacterium]|nr:prepilin-type N-terminal cleavage/methylation domain-containing protein [Candidatus Eremiobacteraeota bacterium]